MEIIIQEMDYWSGSAGSDLNHGPLLSSFYKQQKYHDSDKDYMIKAWFNTSITRMDNVKQFWQT